MFGNNSAPKYLLDQHITHLYEIGFDMHHSDDPELVEEANNIWNALQVAEHYSVEINYG